MEQVPSNPYLGLQIAEDLKWKEHIHNTCRKASSTLGFLRRNLQHCPRECRRTAYIALVRSIIRNNKTGEYSKKGSQVHNQRLLQKQGRRMHD
jgi:hypothetical protein